MILISPDFELILLYYISLNPYNVPISGPSQSIILPPFYARQIDDRSLLSLDKIHHSKGVAVSKAAASNSICLGYIKN